MSSKIIDAHFASQQGHKAFENNKFDEAAKFFKQAVENYNTAFKAGEKVVAALTAAYENLALSYSKSKDHSKAIDTCKEAIASGIKTQDIHNILGFSYLQKGSYKEAITSLSEVMKPEVKNTHPAAHYNLGVSYQADKKIPEAIAQFKKSITLLKDNDVTVGLKSHTKIIECTKNDSKEFHNSLKAAYDYISTNKRTLKNSTTDVNLILEQYAKSCISGNTKDRAEINKIEELYKTFNHGQNLWSILIEDICGQYNANLGKNESPKELLVPAALKQLSNLTKDKDPGCLQAIKQVGVTFLSQLPKNKDLAEKINAEMNPDALAEHLLGVTPESVG